MPKRRELPDLTRLVDDQEGVVNISTTQAPRRTGTAPQVPGMEDEEVLEFFRRFIRASSRPKALRGALARLGIHHQRGRLHPHLTRTSSSADEINVRFTDKREFKQGNRRRPAHRHPR